METGEMTEVPRPGQSTQHENGVYVAGTGSYAPEIAEYAEAAGFQVQGLIELVDPARVGRTMHGLPVIDASAAPAAGIPAVLAAAVDRVGLWEMLAANGWIAPILVHPTAYLSPTVEVARGCIVGPSVVIGAQSSVAAHCLVSCGTLIGHHANIGEGVAINRGTNIAGNVRIGAGAMIGMGSSIVNGMSIGERAIVAAGSVVVRDVPDGARVQGVRAREYTAVGADR
jgi:sugar O-acyltransferase (sialic acid O-acetyltransferase NeuD family)